jgi:hypothetical protein
MSSDEDAGDAEDLEHTTFAILRAAAAFDDRDRVMSFAAWGLQYQATAHSAVTAIPGSCPMSTLPALIARQRSPWRSCVLRACGSALLAATACSAGKRSKCALTGSASSGNRTSASAPLSGSAGPG